MKSIKKISQAIQLKISLKDTKPLVWRKIQILENSSLRALQYAISDVMAWRYMHLYKFNIGENSYGDPELDQEFDGWLDDSKITVGRAIKINPNFEFIYDFGDWWSHIIEFEDYFKANAEERYPVCVAGENAAPPEDCGGVVGFEDYKKTIPRIKFPKPKSIFESLDVLRHKDSFDPTFFDMRAINEIRLGRRRKVNKT